MSDIPKKQKKLYDNQYRIYCKIKMMILDEVTQEINDSSFMKVLVKTQRECFKLDLP